VLQELHEAALRLRDTQRAVRSVTLFGSFAGGVPTPHSDADILVEVAGSLTRAQRREAASDYTDCFQDVSVPVEVFVCTSEELAASLEEGYGVAAAARRAGVRLA
jgi:predicted nucleotidyltransferase